MAQAQACQECGTSPRSDVTNVVFCGLGGQGVIKASDILADAALRAGFDVKKSEIHGMSQRGGSVSSDVRFGKQVLSPMVPAGEVDYLVVVAPDQLANVLPMLGKGGDTDRLLALGRRGAGVGQEPEHRPAGRPQLPPADRAGLLAGMRSRPISTPGGIRSIPRPSRPDIASPPACRDEPPGRRIGYAQHATPLERLHRRVSHRQCPRLFAGRPFAQAVTQPPAPAWTALINAFLFSGNGCGIAG